MVDGQPTIGNYPKRHLSELLCSELRPRLWLASAIAHRASHQNAVPAEVFFSFSNWGEDIFCSSFSSGLILNEIGSVRAQNSLAALNCDGLVSKNYFSNMFLKFSVNYFKFESELVPLPWIMFCTVILRVVGLRDLVPLPNCMRLTLRTSSRNGDVLVKIYHPLQNIS